jgi:hypothetical protein
MNNKKTIERIAIIGLAAFTIGYFVYQVAYGIAMTVLPNGKIMVTDVPQGTIISSATVTYGPHGNVRGDIHGIMGPRPALGDNRTFTEIITPRIINETSNENTNTTSDDTNETQPQQQQPYNAGTAVSNVTGNATEGSPKIHVGPPPLGHQIAKAETYCSQTYLTQQERYNCGYIRGYLDAQRDWNLHRIPPESGGDNSCPHATEHTPEFCNGYLIGYTASWNARLNSSTSTSNSTIPPPSNATSMPPQITKANTDCSRTNLTQQERYNCGYNHGYLAATGPPTTTIGPNGTIVRTGPDNITAMITTQPGSSVGPTTIQILTPQAKYSG